MREATTVTIILIGTLCCLIYLAAERLLQKRDRRQLKHVIYVNGTRGKSSVARMIDAGLRQGGYRVVSKTTGTLPMILHADGAVEEIHRRAPANIREQLRILHLAAKENADVLVVECMALRPDYQFVSQHRMLESDIGVLTNARLDHTDVMGETREEILDVLLNTMPKCGCFLTAESELFSQIEKKGRELCTKTELAVPTPEDSGIDFPENVALARLVCETLGIDADTARTGIRNYIRDPFAKEILRVGQTVFVNALSANDAESTMRICEEALPLLTVSAKRILLINNRGDRPARTLAMAELAEEWKPDGIYLIGEDLSALRLRLHRHLPRTPIDCFRSAEEVPLAQDEPTLLLAVGNIRGVGIELTERTRTLAEREGE